MSLEDTIREVVREAVRTAVRDELRSALEAQKPVTTNETWLTVEQVAERVGGVKPETVRSWIRAGKLAAQRAGHRFIVSPAALEAFLIGSSAPTHRTIDPDEHLSLLMGRVEGKAVKRNKR